MDEQVVLAALEYKAVRSSGPGGQHANKTSTKVILSFDVIKSEGLTDLEKKRILRKLSGRINKENILKMSNEDSRSQHTNKDMVTNTFLYELKEALKRKKPRKKTKPTKASKLKRLQSKRHNSEIKANRKNPFK